MKTFTCVAPERGKAIGLHNSAENAAGKANLQIKLSPAKQLKYSLESTLQLDKNYKRNYSTITFWTKDPSAVFSFNK